MEQVPLTSSVWRVAAHEYRVHIRRGGFLFAAFGVPMLSIGLMVLLTSFLSDRFTEPDDFGRIAVVDDAGIIRDEEWGIFTHYTDQTIAKRDLNTEKVDAILKLPLGYRDQGGAEFTTNQPVDWVIQNEIITYLRSQLIDGISGLTETEKMRAINPGHITLITLENGREMELANTVALFLLPTAFGMIWMLITQITSSYLMNSVAEEKSNRIMELLISSMTAGQLFRGKLVGLLALGLTQLLVWSLVSVVFLFTSGQNISILSISDIPPNMLLISSIYFVLLFALMATVSMTIGAVVGNVQESRQYAGIFSIFIWIPMILMSQLIQNPDSLLPTILTFFPLTAPMTITLRLGLGSITTFQLGVSAFILLITTMAALWAGDRLFRWSLLRYGKLNSVRALLRSLHRRSLEFRV